MGEILDENPPKRGTKGTKIVIFLIIFGLIAFTGYTLYERIQMWKSMGPPPQGPAPVIVTEVQSYAFADEIEAIGTAEADESTTITASETEIIADIAFEDGQFVKKGDLLIQLKNDEEAATYEEARKAYNRYQALVQKNAGSRARRDEAKALMNVAYARVQDRKITAPFDGVTGIRMVSAGDLISPGTVITTLDDIDPIEVEFSVPEEYLAVLNTGLPINAFTTAYPGRPFEGTITSVNPRVNAQTRTVEIKASIDNPDSTLRPGLLMSVNIIKNERQAPAIPEEAIQTQGGQISVMTVVDGEGEEKIAKPAPITIGVRRAGYVEVLSGVNIGDIVISEGIQKARPDGPVNIVETKTIGQQIDKAISEAIPRRKEALENLQAGGELPEGKESADMNAAAPMEKPTQDSMPDDSPSGDGE